MAGLQMRTASCLEVVSGPSPPPATKNPPRTGKDGGQPPCDDDALRVQIASDLHLEMHTKGLPPLEQLPVPTAPVLALLGDVSALGEPGGRAIFEEFLSACHERWRVILLLAGNHEFHTCSAPREQLRTAREVLACMRGLTDRFPKLRVLQNEAITIDGVRVVGSVLWTHVPP